jgi:hypothetical protein
MIVITQHQVQSEYFVREYIYFVKLIVHVKFYVIDNMISQLFNMFFFQNN